MVYATKTGFDNSKTTVEFVFPYFTAIHGDVNSDGKINVADHLRLIEIIMNKTNDAR